MRFLRGFLTRLAFALCLAACVLGPNSSLRLPVPLQTIAVEGNQPRRCRHDPDLFQGHRRGSGQRGRAGPSTPRVCSRTFASAATAVASSSTWPRTASSTASPSRATRRSRASSSRPRSTSKTRGPYSQALVAGRRSAHPGDLPPLGQRQRQGHQPHRRPAERPARRRLHHRRGLARPASSRSSSPATTPIRRASCAAS